MITTKEALLNAILAAPGDDAPRLVYADWLQENGEDERAEFIRLQCGRPRQPRVRLPNHDEIRKQENRLLRKRKLSWFALLGKEPFSCHFVKRVGMRIAHWQLLNGAIVTGYIKRGFVFRLDLREGIWLDFGRQIVAEHPIEIVQLTGKSPARDAHGQPDRRWWWSSVLGPSTKAPDSLSLEIFDLLSGRKMPSAGGGGFSDYALKREAISDLNQALLAFAKQGRAF